MNPTLRRTTYRCRTKERNCIIRSATATLLLLLILLNVAERVSQARAWQPISESRPRPIRYAESCGTAQPGQRSTVGPSQCALSMLALPEGASSSSSSQYNPSPPRTWSQRPSQSNVHGADNAGTALSLPLSNWFSPAARTTNDTSSSRLSWSFPVPLRGSTTSPLSSASSTSVPQRRARRRQKMKPMPILGYDALAIEEYYDVRPLEVGWRLNSLGFPLLGTFIVDGSAGSCKIVSCTDLQSA
jgi:hypothetical protein